MYAKGKDLELTFNCKSNCNANSCSEIETPSMHINGIKNKRIKSSLNLRIKNF